MLKIETIRENLLTFVLTGLLLIILIGFAAGFVIEDTKSCNLMGCPCPDSENTEYDSERIDIVEDDKVRFSYNSCTKFSTIFYTYVFNIGKSCNGTEYLTCEGVNQTDRTVEYDGECSYNVAFFSTTMH